MLLNIIKLQKNLLSVHPAPEKKKGSNLFIPLFLHVSDKEWSCSNPSPPSHRKSSNIYIFNPIKNVKKKEKKKENNQSALRHAAKYQQSSSVLHCCDLHRSEVLVLFQAPFSASWKSGNKRRRKSIHACFNIRSRSSHVAPFTCDTDTFPGKRTAKPLDRVQAQ